MISISYLGLPKGSDSGELGGVVIGFRGCKPFSETTSAILLGNGSILGVDLDASAGLYIDCGEVASSTSEIASSSK